MPLLARVRSRKRITLLYKRAQIEFLCYASLMQKLKVCKGCQLQFPLEKFPKKSGKVQKGYRSRCTTCFERHRRLRNPNRLKKSPHYEARKNARREYGPASQWACSVLMCESPASDLHHFDYSKALSVIPLCREHHFEIHGKDFSKKDT